MASPIDENSYFRQFQIADQEKIISHDRLLKVKLSGLFRLFRLWGKNRKSPTCSKLIWLIWGRNKKKGRIAPAQAYLNDELD
jgi:hypothetical protein